MRVPIWAHIYVYYRVFSPTRKLRRDEMQSNQAASARLRMKIRQMSRVLKYKTQGFSALIVQTLNIASEGQPRLSLSQLKFLTKYVTIFWHNFEWQLSGPGCFFGNFRDTVIWLSELRSFWVGVPGLLSFTLQFRPCKILGHILSFIWSIESKNFVQARNPGSQSQLGAVESRYNTLTSIISKKHSGNVTKFMTPAC